MSTATGRKGVSSESGEKQWEKRKNKEMQWVHVHGGEIYLVESEGETARRPDRGVTCFFF